MGDMAAMDCVYVHRMEKIFVQFVVWVSKSKNILTSMWQLDMLIMKWPTNNSMNYIWNIKIPLILYINRLSTNVINGINLIANISKIVNAYFKSWFHCNSKVHNVPKSPFNYFVTIRRDLLYCIIISLFLTIKNTSRWIFSDAMSYS